MKQKYLILKNDDTNKLTIKEFAELQPDVYSLACEETYDGDVIKSAITRGKKALISTLRTTNLFPPGSYAEKIAESVINLYSLGLRISKRNLKDFMASMFQSRRQLYQYIYQLLKS